MLAMCTHLAPKPFLLCYHCCVLLFGRVSHHSYVFAEVCNAIVSEVIPVIQRHAMVGAARVREHTHYPSCAPCPKLSYSAPHTLSLHLLSCPQIRTKHTSFDLPLARDILVDVLADRGFQVAPSHKHTHTHTRCGFPD